MVSRFPPVILVSTSLVVGLVVGFSLGRGGPVASAQVGSPDRGRASAPPGRDSAATHQVSSRSSQARREDARIYDQVAKEYERFEHVNRMFELVAKAVSPTVVHIVAQKTVRHEESQRTRKFEETGSGVIVRSDKNPGLYVLTNHHVVGGGRNTKIKVLLQDGRALVPARIWSDGKADIAVLKLDRDDLPAARIGDSDTASVGTWVLALGSPFGLRHSVSQGIISARSRHVEELQDVENQDFLQTDAAINPGNSGGPLVNMKGEVIGINNSIASNGGGNEGVGFSIPINLARWIMDELISHGRVVRGALGVDLQRSYLLEDAIRMGLDRPRGAWIDKVYAESPAAKAGLNDGDVILRFGGAEITDLNHLINAVSMTQVGVPAEVVIWRDRQELKLKVTVGEREQTLSEVPVIQSPPQADDPSGLVRRPDRPRAESTSFFAMGLELVTINPQLALRYGLPDSTKGAMIVAVEDDSPLARLCEVHDVVASINDEPVRSAEQAAKGISEHQDHGPLLLSVDRRVEGEIHRFSFRVP